jgi:hypothetical protein
MNIIAIRQEQRFRQIKQIEESIRLALAEGKEILYDNVVISSMSNLNISKRTAREYVDVAYFNLNLKK